MEFRTASDPGSGQGFVYSDAGEGPLVVLFHGLEGSSRSHYAASLMAFM